MLSSCSIIGFIPTSDAARARKFYVDLLGLTFETEDDFALVVRSGLSMIRLAKLKEFTPADYTILGWETPQIAAAVADLEKAGVPFLRFPFMEQTGPPIWTAPDGAQVAWFKDPDGNTLSLSQH